jgi:hypothetical protein
VARELFTREDAVEVARRHAIAVSVVPVDFDAQHCDCGLGDQNRDLKAHYARRCWKAAAYIKQCEWAGIPLKFKEFKS